MKRFLIPALLATCAPAACAPGAGAEAQAATESVDASCTAPESGIIRPETPGLPDKRLEGPIMVKTLQAIVDPANPHGGSFVWSRENVAMIVSDFKGPFYLAEGETLFARPEFSPLGIAYSGCRLD